MMNQETGRFERPRLDTSELDKMTVGDADIDTAFAPTAAARPVRTRVLPTLAEGEPVIAGIEHGNFPVLGDIEIIVEKIKLNGKLFVFAPVDVKKVSVGNILSIKGVKFSVRRVNALGQIGLRMLTTAEIVALESLPKPMTLAEQDAALKARGIPSIHPASFEEPKNTPHPLYTPTGPTKSQVARAERRERRLEEIAIRRAKNKQESEYARDARGEKAAEDGPLLTKAERREQGALKAAERNRRKKLEPMLKAQAAARARAEADRASRKTKPKADLVVGVF